MSCAGQLTVGPGERRTLASHKSERPQLWAVVVEVDPVPSGAYVADVYIDSGSDNAEFEYSRQLTISGDSARLLACVWGDRVSVDVHNLTSTAQMRVTAAMQPASSAFESFAEQH